MNVRVIGGQFRSRRLKSPGKLAMRPTSDRLRETLFNVLGPSIEDSLFFDLYAGTGAVGIEAISRGAREAIFVESHRAAAQLIRENVESLKIESRVEVMEAETIRALEKIAQRKLMADFIFLDPPYDAAEERLRVLEFLDESHLVAPSGIVIVEHSVKADLPERFDGLELSRLLEQGDAALSFYRLALAA
jgi:16S rRNA (guanine966-N2)-methyltransferase